MKTLSCGIRSFPPRAALAAFRPSVTLVAVIALCAGAPSSAAAALAAAIVVRYPAPDQEIGPFDKSFAIGSAPPGSLVTVNGVRARIAPDG